ncbi:MAG: hypothetical protein GY810_02640 [Aureispira sp.]|nr:hypothetical protein [Aureispira sp.]
MKHSTNKYYYWLIILLPFFTTACQTSARGTSEANTFFTIIIAIFGLILLIIPFIVSKQEKSSSEGSSFIEIVALILLMLAIVGVLAWSILITLIISDAFEHGFYDLILIDLVLFGVPATLLGYIVNMWGKRTTKSPTDYDSLIDDDNNTV